MTFPFKRNKGSQYAKFISYFPQSYFHKAVPRGLRQELNPILMKVLDILSDFKDFGAGVILVQKPEQSSLLNKVQIETKKPDQQEHTAQCTNDSVGSFHGCNLLKMQCNMRSFYACTVFITSL